MRLKLFVTPEGAEQIALGRPLYYWQIIARIEGDTIYPEDPKDSILIGHADVLEPAVSQCRMVAETVLKAKLQEVRAEAFKSIQEVETRISHLLAITYEAGGTE